MDRKDIEKRVRQWEAEGYEVSDFRRRWFPEGHGGGNSGARIVLSRVIAVLAVVIALLILRTPQSAPHLDVGEIQIVGRPFVIEPQQVAVTQGWTIEGEHGLGIDAGCIQAAPADRVFEAELGRVTKVWADEPELGLTVEIGEVQLQPGTWMIYTETGCNLDEGQ